MPQMYKGKSCPGYSSQCAMSFERRQKGLKRGVIAVHLLLLATHTHISGQAMRAISEILRDKIRAD